jgi:hypothetical protein
MKKLMTLLSLITLILVTPLFAQGNEGPKPWGRMGGKIQQLEKIKIIEELNMDEETTLKFFSRRTEHRENQKYLIEKKNELLEDINKSLNAEYNINYKEKAEEIFGIEQEMLSKREKFFNSLVDILTEKQMVQLIVFEFNFRNEMRHQFIKQNQRRMKHN